MPSTSNQVSKWVKPSSAIPTIAALFLAYKAVETAWSQRQQSIEQSPTSPVILAHSRMVSVGGGNNGPEKKLRIVHIPHELGSKVPLMVFIHGVGGQLEQFEKQIEYFSLSTHILAIDLCGYGASEMPDSFADYTTDSYVDDILTLLQRYRSNETILVCHSYGCAIGTLLYQRSPNPGSIKAMVFICPKAAFTRHEINSRQKLLKTPSWIIELARMADRRGGAHSASVNRLVHESASEDLRRKQLKWNKSSKTFVLKRLTAGIRWPSLQDFQRIQCPLVLLAGDDDKVCPSVNVEQIYAWCQATNPDVQAPFVIPKAGHQAMLERWELVNPIISTFLIKDCGMTTMDPAWQITRKSKMENKWSLKNMEKWQNTPIISAPIGKWPGKFRAMKVLRQTDPDHSPSAFLAHQTSVGFVVDISLDEPPYRTSDFESTNVIYTKLATVSKIPPTQQDVDRFVAHCKACWAMRPNVDIAVHCHYGFNRTGFMIVCFLIQEQGYSVNEALLEFEKARPPRGIRHDHFKGELYLRYEPPLQMQGKKDRERKI